MRKLAAIALVLAGCQEPPQTGRYEASIRGLADLHTWDPGMGGAGNLAYEAVVSSFPEILPLLVAHVTDETPTALREPRFDVRPTVGDVCFLILLQELKLNWEAFYDDGLFLSKQLENPVYSIRWKDRASKARVQQKLARIVVDLESKKDSPK